MIPYILIPKSHPLALWLLLWSPTSWFQSHTLWPSGCYYDPLHLDSKVTPFGPLVVTMIPYILIPKSHPLALRLLLWSPTSWFQSHTLWPSGCYYDPLHLDSKVTPFGPLVVTMTPYILIPKSHPLALWLLLWPPTSWFHSCTPWSSGCYYDPLHLDSKVPPLGPQVVIITLHLDSKVAPLGLQNVIITLHLDSKVPPLGPQVVIITLHLDSKVAPLGLQNVIITLHLDSKVPPLGPQVVIITLHLDSKVAPLGPQGEEVVQNAGLHHDVPSALVEQVNTDHWCLCLGRWLEQRWPKHSGQVVDGHLVLCSLAHPAMDRRDQSKANTPVSSPQDLQRHFTCDSMVDVVSLVSGHFQTTLIQ